MTLACGNTSSAVAKLSTNCVRAQSLVVSFIPISIVVVADRDGERRGAVCPPRPASIAPLMSEAA
jgi:hypothetical protein